MSEGSEFGNAVGDLYKKLCKDEWSPITSGIIVAFLSVMMLAWMRPWGAVGAMRNWGEWIIYGCGFWETLGLWGTKAHPTSALTQTSSVIGIGFVAGSFLSANLGDNFDIRIPPFLEMLKAVIAGVLMGVGATLSGGCNVGGFYNAIGNLSASGFTMWLGLVLGVILGLKYIYWEMENITWGSGGAKTIEFPVPLRRILAIATLAGLIWGGYEYIDMDASNGMLGGLLLIAAGLGYTMQRGRWCMVQGFREPHMTGNCSMAKGVIVSILLLATGITILKFTELRSFDAYVRGTFGWGGVLGGFLFGLGAMFAGGCGTGTLWRVGEGQIKLWIVVPIMGITSALCNPIVKARGWEATESNPSALLGKWVYMPDTFLGYGGTLALIFVAMGAWYLVATWNEKSNKLIVEM